MTVESTPDAAGPGTPPPPAGKGWTRHLKLAGIVAVSALAGAFLSGAARHWHHGYHGPGHFMSGPVDPAGIDKRVDWMTSKIARDVDATAEQKTKLAEIAKAAATDLLPLREKMIAGRKEARDLLVQPSVDRAAIEKLRADQLANMDALSKRLSEAVAAAAEVLTPEQRKKLADRFPPGGHGWRHGQDRG